MDQIKRHCMKKLLILFVIAFFANGFSQYRDSGFPTESVYDGIVKSEPHSLFGFLDSDNLKMSHSFEMSYSTFAGQGLALGSYTNSLSYKFSNSLKFLLETSIVTSPYSSLGKNYQNAINGIYINRAQLNFKPWKNVDVILQYRQFPASAYYNPYYNNYGFGRSGFLNSYGYDNWNYNSGIDKE